MVLADDPGSSVLTLTSLGMAGLCRPPDIKTTSRYAHVLDSEVGIAMEEVSRDRRNSAENSPNKSPRLDRKVG